MIGANGAFKIVGAKPLSREDKNEDQYDNYDNNI